MNAHRLRNVPLVAKWPIAPYRSASNKARSKPSTKPAPIKRPNATPRLRNPDPRASQASSPNPNPSPKPTHGIPPRALTFLGIAALTISTYCGYLYTSYTREVNKSQALHLPPDVSDRYNTTAATFDADVELSEKTMGLGTKRRDLVRQARGHVLEVSCGTGRNLPFYSLGERRGVDAHGHASVVGCRSVTFTDLSPQMVDIARAKFQALYPGTEGVFRVCDAAEVEPTGTRWFDTVVQTMGLCSMGDPVATLRHLGEVTEPDRGRILLLEHGRSYYDWVNRILDNLAPAHADRHGCWWNRDIGAIVRESGLEIVEEKRWHLGTTWRYVLRPRQDEKTRA